MPSPSRISLRGVSVLVLAACAIPYMSGAAFAQDAPISASGSASWSAPSSQTPPAATVVHSTNAGLKIDPLPAAQAPVPSAPAKTYAAPPAPSPRLTSTASPHSVTAPAAAAAPVTLPTPTTPVPQTLPTVVTKSAPRAPAPAGDYVLPRGVPLSHALESYVSSLGWTLRWNIHDDYVLDAPFPIPQGDDVIKGVTYVVRAYQSQGGLLGATPMFAMPNHVVVIQDSHAPRGN